MATAANTMYLFFWSFIKLVYDMIFILLGGGREGGLKKEEDKLDLMKPQKGRPLCMTEGDL